MLWIVVSIFLESAQTVEVVKQWLLENVSTFMNLFFFFFRCVWDSKACKTNKMIWRMVTWSPANAILSVFLWKQGIRRKKCGRIRRLDFLGLMTWNTRLKEIVKWSWYLKYTYTVLVQFLFHPIKQWWKFDKILPAVLAFLEVNAVAYDPWFMSTK